MAEQCLRQAVRALNVHINTTAPEQHVGRAMVVHGTLVFQDSFCPLPVRPTPGHLYMAELCDSTDVPTKRQSA